MADRGQALTEGRLVKHEPFLITLRTNSEAAAVISSSVLLRKLRD